MGELGDDPKAAAAKAKKGKAVALQHDWQKRMERILESVEM